MHCAALIVVPDSVADPVALLPGERRQEPGVRRAPAAQRLHAADLQLLRRHLPGRRRPHRRRGLAARPAEPVRADQGGVRGDARRHRRGPARSACCRCATSTRSAPTPRCAPGCSCGRPTHALGKMIEAYEEGVPFQITGTDWPTRDGSGIRDYVHVWDLAAAHVAALRRFDALLPATGDRDQPRHRHRHHGAGAGRRVQPRSSDQPIEAVEAARRPGDVAGRLHPQRPRRAPAGLAGRVTRSRTGSGTRWNGPACGTPA